jgi:hypothetical protein
MSTQIQTATIANTGTVSTEVLVLGYTAVSLVVPTMTGTALTFQGRYGDAGDYLPIYGQDGEPVTVTLGDPKAGLYTFFDLPPLLGLRYLKIVSDSAEGAERTIGVVSARAIE